MTIEELRRLRLAHPFRPFDLVVEDGRRFVVKQPYHMAISPAGNAIAVANGESVELLKPEWVNQAIVHPIQSSGAATTTAKSRESA